MRLQLDFTIHVDRPPRHRLGSDAWRCARQLESGITIREFISRVCLGEGFDEITPRWYVSAWIRRTNIHLESADGVVLRHVSHREAMAFVASPLEEILTSYTFGVELEFMAPRGMARDGVARAISSAGVSCLSEVYNHLTRNHWKVVSDSSLTHGNGMEVVSPILRGDDGLRQVAAVCKVLTEMNAKITSKCGLHVHVGASNKQLPWFKNLVANYAAHEDVIDSILPASRRGNAYCGTIRHYVDGVNGASSLQLAVNLMAGRYHKVNLQAFLRHGTVEFRQHSGTVEAEKAINWIKFCLRMCSAAEREGPVQTAANLGDLLSLLSVTEEERSYFNSRAVKFVNERLVS